MSGPKDGDVVLHCGHPDREGQHFFQIDLPFVPPGTTDPLLAKWVIQCDECFGRLPKRPEIQHFAIGGHDTWVGDDPVINNPISETN